mgnify:FL=1
MFSETFRSVVASPYTQTTISGGVHQNTNNNDYFEKAATASSSCGACGASAGRDGLGRDACDVQSSLLTNVIRRREASMTSFTSSSQSSSSVMTAYSSAEPPSKAVSFAKDVFAGTCGGITVTLLGHPFDTVKVLLQTQSSTNPAYSGAVDAATKVLKSEGIGGLYKGVMSPLAGQMFFRATLFFAYARAKEFVGVSPDDPLSYCKAGGLAWLAGSFFESPIDLFKSQSQQQILRAKADPSYVPQSMGASVKDAVKYMGPRGPWYGMGATLARNLPAGSVYFGVFENTKNWFASRNDDGKASNSEICFAGGLGGIFYWSFFYPIDVIKSAVMTDKLNPAERRFNGYGDAMGALYKEGGFGRFYRGLFPCLLRASPANAGMLFTVDYIRRIID